LTGPLPAGRWHLVGDVEVLNAGDVRYDFIWRRGGIDTTLVSFTHHFEPPASGFAATLYDADGTGIAAAAAAGDQLVWRWSVTSGPPDASVPWVIFPNGDGTSSGGRFPSITLPPPPSTDGGP
jgi:hypothetical protein